MNTNITRPEGIDDKKFQRAWDSLSEADRQVLLVTARNGYNSKVKHLKRKKRQKVKQK